MHKIFNIGVTESLPSSLRDKIRLTNQIAVVITFLTLMFLMTTLEYRMLNMVSLIGVFSSIGVLFLNYLKKYRTSRILLCLYPPIILSLTQAIIVQPGDPLILGATINLIAMIIPPFLIFDIREKVVLLPVIIIISCIFLLQDNINQWLQVPMDSSFFYGPYITISSNVVNLLIIIFFLFFFLNQKMESEKQKSDEVKLLLESSENMITLHDNEGKYLYYNGPKCYDISSNDIVGKHPLDFFDKKEAELILRGIKKAYTTGKSTFIENQLDWQGEKKWFSEYIYPVFDGEGKIKYAAKVCVDINEQKIAKQKLKESTKKLSLIYHNTKDMMALIRCDAPGQFTLESINNASLQWLQKLNPTLQLEDVLNLNIELFYKNIYDYSDELIANRILRLKNIANQKESVTYNSHLEIATSTDIEIAHLETTVAPILDDQEKASYLLMVSRDITDRLKAEKDLKKSEQQLSLIFNSTESEIGLIKVVDKDLFILESLNKAAKEKLIKFGLIDSDLQLIGMEAQSFYKNVLKYPDEKINEKLDTFRQLVSSKEPVEYEYVHQGANGKKEYFFTKLLPILNNSGDCTQILFATENVTQSKKANQDLVDSQEKLSLVFNNTQSYMLLIRYDHQKGFLVESFNEPGWNSLRRRGSTLKEEDIYEKSIENFYIKTLDYDDEIIQERINLFLEVVKSKAPIVYEGSAWVQPDNKNLVYYENTISPIKDEKGEVKYLLFTTRDITEKKVNQILLEKSQQEIQQQLEQKKLILDSTLNGYILVNEETKIIDVNVAYCELSGYSREELLQMYIADLEGNKNPDGPKSRAKKVLSKGAARIETIHYTKDGKELILDANLSRIHQDGQLFIAGFMSDITDQKKTQQELQYRLTFETLLTRLSNQFINVNIEDIDKEIILALKQIGEFTHFDRAFVNLFSDDGEYISNEYEWCIEGINPIGQKFQKVPLSNFPYINQRLKNNEPIVVKNLADLPEAAGNFQNTIQSLGLKSLVQVPLTWGGETIGLIGFDSFHQLKEWPKDLVVLLRFAGEMITNVLQRKKSELALRKSEQQLSTIYNNSLDNISLIRVESKGQFTVQAINKPALKFTEENRSEKNMGILSKEVRDVFKNYFDMPDPDIDERYVLMQEVVKSERPVRSKSYIPITPKGEYAVFENILSPIMENGRCINILYVSRNITERERAKEALMESEKRMSSVFNSTKDQMAIFNIEKDGDILLEQVNKSFKESWEKTGYGKNVDVLIGKDLNFYSRVVLQDTKEQTKERLELLKKIIQQKKPYSFEEEYRDLKGKSFFMDVSIYPILDDAGDCAKILFVARDITFKKEANERIISNILETEDRERKRIAKELHDSLGQNLTTVSLNLNHFKKINPTLDEKLQQRLNTSLKFLDLAIDESRNIAHNLMPQSIVDFGYAITVASLVEDLSIPGELEFLFYTNLNEKRLPPDYELSLFRITQEAINNILKHANATKATIQLMEYHDVILLTIEDNGIGFNVTNNEVNSFGLDSIKNRVKALSGKINIDSRPTKGTSITIEIPNIY